MVGGKEERQADGDFLEQPDKSMPSPQEEAHDGASSFKQMGLQEAKLLQLPTACNLVNANISDCPKLLNLAPNSPDMGIFTNSTNCNLVKQTLVIVQLWKISALLEEKERADQIYQDLSSFKDQAIQQEKLVSVIRISLRRHWDKHIYMRTK
ncbi:hypothetical protein IFM89_014884 [Coptis chinensis]|uniref:Uncharacterized protein n=1 Tax=Coptis chinensis TaxID=261450 RepID=A0A835HEL3_9MAGN|nr:hypothetical protein IFM89_014884 [Coptis chinensis]